MKAEIFIVNMIGHKMQMDTSYLSIFENFNLKNKIQLYILAQKRNSIYLASYSIPLRLAQEAAMHIVLISIIRTVVS